MKYRGITSLTLILIITGVALASIGGYTYFIKYHQPQIIGGETDEHGCLIAAGYSWCEPKQKCLRTWEEPCEETTTTVFTTTTSKPAAASSQWTCGDPFIDPRNDKEYSTVLIGDQCWMGENLDYDDGCTNKTWVNSTDVGWCGYFKGGPYPDEGLYYQWSAAMAGSTEEGAQGICPDGWYVPTDADWTELEIQICEDIGNSNCAATFTGTTGYRGDGEAAAMAGNASLWTDCTPEIKPIDDPQFGRLKRNINFGASGLDILPVGYRCADGIYLFRSGGRASVWSSSEDGEGLWQGACYRHLYCDAVGIFRNDRHNTEAYSVRCLKK